MSNPHKRKGDSAERDAAAILNDELGVNCRRALGAGRKDDVGDIHGLEDCVIQVTAIRDLDLAVRVKLPDVERQRENAGVNFGALWCRRYGGKFVVVMTPEMFCALYREAL